jgi:hypothetical protein
MSQLTRASNLALAALCATLAALAAPAGSLAAESVDYTEESFKVFERQLDGHQVAAATFNKRVRSMRVTLKNGDHKLVTYPPHQASATITKVEAKHVPVTVLTPAQAKAEERKKPVHHKLRYIALAVVVVVIVLVGAFLVFRRRRERD